MKEVREVTGYMCKIDWDFELGSAPGGIPVYESIDDLKDHHDCWPQCGIVEVTVSLSRVLVKSDFSDVE